VSGVNVWLEVRWVGVGHECQWGCVWRWEWSVVHAGWGFGIPYLWNDGPWE